MAHLHSNAILLGIKDPHIKLKGEIRELFYYQLHPFRPSARSHSLDLNTAYQQVLTLAGISITCLQPAPLWVYEPRQPRYHSKRVDEDHVARRSV